jgi:tight adherence protein B
VNESLLGPGLVAGATAFTVIALGFLASWLGDMRRKRALAKQLAALSQPEQLSNPATVLLLRADASEPEWLRHLIARVPRLRKTQLLFRQAGLEWTLRRFMWYSLAWAWIIAMTLGPLTHSYRITPVVIIAAFAPTIYAKFRKNRRRQEFQAQLADAIDLLARALRAGHPLSSGFRLVADESPEPIRGEFRRVFEEQRFGMSVDESLHSMIQRMDLLDVRMLVTAILIQRDVGGNLAETIDKLSEVIRTRFAVMGKLRGYTAQARLSGYILALLPVVLGFILFLLNPPYIIALFVDPLGRVMLAGSITLQFMGFMWIRKIVDVKY